MEGLGVYGSEEKRGLVSRKRVLVVVDESSCSKHAMMWALTHLTAKSDLLTLLHVISPRKTVERTMSNSSLCSPHLATTLAYLCKACKPEVEVEAVAIQGPKLATVMSQVRKLEATVLVLGQKTSHPLINCLCRPSKTMEFVEQCINTADCLTIGVSKQSKGIGGYLINTRLQKNFWLLA